MIASSLLVEPAYHSAPPYTQTLGPEVADLASLVGFTPDPEQRLALDSIFALDSTGKAAAFEAAVVAPRQNIKTGLFKICALGWLYVTDQRLVIWSAHEFSTAQEAFRDMTQMIEGSDFLLKRVKHIHRGNGDEAIELTTGQRVKFKARTKGGGRGLSGDKVVLDEAFALQPIHLGALLPTLSARPDPQVVYGSSAGLAESDVLRAIRDRGRRGDDPSLVYLEWCDDLGGGCATEGCDHALDRPGCRLDDRARWGRANSQMGRRISIDYIAAERRALPAEEFARERLGDWDDPSGAGIFPSNAWDDLADVRSGIHGRPVFGLDMTPDRSRASIGVAGLRSDELVHIEVIDNEPGTTWIVDRCIALQAAHGGDGFVVDKGAAAGNLIQPLRDAGLSVTEIGAREYVEACGSFYDAVMGSTLRHQGRFQPELAAAVNGARRRPLGDAWVWDRKNPIVDITPLVSVTLAAWGVTRARELEPSVVFI